MRAQFKNALRGLAGREIKTVPIITKTIPRHLKKYPNWKFRPSDIIHYTHVIKGNPDFSKIDELPLSIRFQKKRLDPKLKEQMYFNWI